MSRSAEANGREVSSPHPAKIVKINRSEAASIALKVAINDRVGKSSPRWMRDVAEQMGVGSA